MIMAVLFNKEQNKYIGLNLFTTNEPDWLTYSLCGGNINRQQKKELFRLENDDLFLHDAEYEKEVEIIIDGLTNIRESCRFTFQPVDEGEFRLESDYKNHMVHIKFRLYQIDKMENEGIPDNVFVIDTTYFLLYEFLTELREEYITIKFAGLIEEKDDAVSC